MLWLVLAGAGCAVAAAAVALLFVRSRTGPTGRAQRDEADRHGRALKIHDDVIQCLVAAKLAFELDDRDRGMAAVEAALDNARRIMTELIGDGPTPLSPGQLRRDGPAAP